MSDLENEIRTLEGAIKAAEKDAVKAPSETLNIVSTKGYNYYKLRNKGTKQRRLSNKDDLKVIKCAQADYAKAFLKVAKKTLENMKQMNSFNTEELCSVFETLHPARKLIVTPYILSTEQFAEEWHKQTWNLKNPYEISGDLKTLNGETVRSKSEQIIANQLFHKGIPYFYEKPLILPSGQVRFPDFTILNKRTKKEYILEHFGCMDDPDYRKRTWKKIQEYGKAGFVLGDNFIFTFEEGGTPFNTDQLNLYINTLFQ